MAAKKKIINIKVYFDGDQDAKEVFAASIVIQDSIPAILDKCKS